MTLPRTAHSLNLKDYLPITALMTQIDFAILAVCPGITDLTWGEATSPKPLHHHAMKI